MNGDTAAAGEPRGRRMDARPMRHMGDYLRLRQTEERLRRAARDRGLAGDPLGDVGDVADTAAEQLAAIALWLALPATWRRDRASWDMARATAYGRVA